jgi:TctA family transporter
MDLLHNLSLGLSVAASPINILYCFVGAAVGTLVGVLPGIGPVATVAMLLPVTFGLPPITGLIMLAGIYYGAQYGGSISAILVNLPGEASSIVTCLDGYQMARQGRAGAALGIAAIGSFFAGCMATLLIALFAPPLAAVALSFGPAEHFSLLVLGLVMAVVIARGSVVKAVGMLILGLLFGSVGTDITFGVERFTFGIPELTDGFNFVVAATGMYAIGDILVNLDAHEERQVFLTSVQNLLPNREDLLASWAAVLRGTGIGALLGVFSGGGAVLASFASYSIEKRCAGDPSRFGKGAIEGVAAPESANNAAAQTSFVPLLTLGIPSNAIMALMIGAMTIHGIVPGPMVMTSNPDLFWGLIASMWIGNLVLVILNLPLIRVWVTLLTIPYRLLYPAILLFCCMGVFSLSHSTFDILMAGAFGVLGYVFIKLGCERTPLLLGFVLGPSVEENPRRAMLLSRGDASVFLTRPISLTLLILAIALVVTSIIKAIRSGRQTDIIEA